MDDDDFPRAAPPGDASLSVLRDAFDAAFAHSGALDVVTSGPADEGLPPLAPPAAPVFDDDDEYRRLQDAAPREDPSPEVDAAAHDTIRSLESQLASERERARGLESQLASEREQAQSLESQLASEREQRLRVDHRLVLLQEEIQQLQQQQRNSDQQQQAAQGPPAPDSEIMNGMATNIKTLNSMYQQLLEEKLQQQKDYDTLSRGVIPPVRVLPGNVVDRTDQIRARVESLMILPAIQTATAADPAVSSKLTDILQTVDYLELGFIDIDGTARRAQDDAKSLQTSLASCQAELDRMRQDMRTLRRETSNASLPPRPPSPAAVAAATSMREISGRVDDLESQVARDRQQWDELVGLVVQRSVGVPDPPQSIGGLSPELDGSLQKMTVLAHELASHARTVPPPTSVPHRVQWIVQALSIDSAMSASLQTALAQVAHLANRQASDLHHAQSQLQSRSTSTSTREHELRDEVARLKDQVNRSEMALQNAHREVDALRHETKHAVMMSSSVSSPSPTRRRGVALNFDSDEEERRSITKLQQQVDRTLRDVDDAQTMQEHENQLLMSEVRELHGRLQEALRDLEHVQARTRGELGQLTDELQETRQRHRREAAELRSELDQQHSVCMQLQRSLESLRASERDLIQRAVGLEADVRTARISAAETSVDAQNLNTSTMHELGEAQRKIAVLERERQSAVQDASVHRQGLEAERRNVRTLEGMVGDLRDQLSAAETEARRHNRELASLRAAQEQAEATRNEARRRLEQGSRKEGQDMAIERDYWRMKSRAAAIESQMLEREVQGVKRALDDALRQLDQQHMNENYRTQFKIINEQYAQLQADNDEMRIALRNSSSPDAVQLAQQLSKENAYLTERLSVMRNEADQLKRAIEDEVDRAADLEAAIERERASGQRSVADLEQSLQATEARATSLGSKCASLERDLDRAQNDLASLRASADSQRADAAEVADTLRSKLSRSEQAREELQTRLRALEASSQDQLLEHEHLARQVAQLTATHESLANEHAHRERMLEEEVLDLSRKVKALSEDLQARTGELDAQRQANGQLATQQQQLSSQLDGVSRDLETARGHAQSVEGQLADRTALAEKLREHAGDLEQELYRARERASLVESLQSETADLTRRLGAEEARCAQMQVELETAVSDHGRTQAELSDVSKEGDMLRKSVHDLRAALQEQAQMAAASKQRADAVVSELESLRAAHSQHSSQMAVARQQAERLLKENETLVRQVEDLRGSPRRGGSDPHAVERHLRVELERAETRAVSAEKRAAGEHGELRRRIQEVEAQNSDLQRQLGKADAGASSVRSEKARLENKVSTLRAEIEELRNSQSTQSRVYQDRIAELEKQQVMRLSDGPSGSGGTRTPHYLHQPLHSSSASTARLASTPRTVTFDESPLRGGRSAASPLHYPGPAAVSTPAAATPGVADQSLSDSLQSVASDVQRLLRRATSAVNSSTPRRHAIGRDV